MNIQSLNIPGFEEVVKYSDPVSGLRAFIAVHSTRLGPSLGGIRMRAYKNEDEALQDVLKLAEAMSYKAAAAGVKLGGGKAVIMGDPDADKNPALLKAMGRFVNSLEGRYLAAKDAGITTEDLILLHETTEFVTGLPLAMGGSDDPSPLTARGIFEAIKFCANYRYGHQNLAGLEILIQGMGHVGLYLGKLLAEEKASLTVSDVQDSAIRKAQSLFPAKVVHPDDVFRTPAQIIAPCAYGGVIDDITARTVTCDIIAGGANNQLQNHIKHGNLLRDRGILYAPDYVINAGGIINIYVLDILKEKNPEAFLKVIPENLDSIFTESMARQIGTAEAADILTAKKLCGEKPEIKEI